MSAPSIGIEDEITLGEIRQVALEDLTHSPAVANLTRLLVTSPTPPPLVGVERQIDGASKQLARPWVRYRTLPPGEIVRPWQTFGWCAREKPLLTGVQEPFLPRY
jgi:hypothetical protein